MKNPIHGLQRQMLSADIPLSFDRGLPEIHISAMQSIRIEPHRGVRSFSQDSVLIDTGGGLIHIQGKDLVLKSMSWRELCVLGRISAVGLISDDAV